MPNGQCLDIKFIFDKTVDRGSDLPYAFTDFNKVKSSGNSLVDKINGYGNINNQKIYYPTQELKDGIERFMFGYGTPNFKPDWNKIYYEYNDTNECGMYVTRAAVTCIDIYKLLPEIYGYKDENNESHLIMCNMSKGKLLIPVGAGAKWLFNKHSDISIHVFQDDVEVATPNINEIKFLKLREVN